jgi:epoxyqueuosine reductase
LSSFPKKPTDRRTGFSTPPGDLGTETCQSLGNDGRQFREKFRGSPVKRAKWRGLVRNVAAALSGSDEPEAENALTKALNHPEQVVRQQASVSLEEIRKRQVSSG